MTSDQLLGLIPWLGFALAILAIPVGLVLLAKRRSAGQPGAFPVPARVPAPSIPPVPGEVLSREETAVVEWLLARALAETGTDMRGDKLARQRIAEAARKAVQELKTAPVASVNLPFISAGPGGPVHLSADLRAEELRGLLR